MNSKGTFLYPAIVDRLNQSQTPADVYTKTQSDAKYAKLGEANTFTGTNTFNEDTNFNNTINFKNPSNNNGAFLDNFVYNRNNLTALKFVKNNNTALMILEVNNDNSSATISSPSTNNNLAIKNLKNPTENNDAANKNYVDNIVKYVEKAGGLSFTRQPLNTTSGNELTKYYAYVSYSSIPVPNGKHIISCYSKSIPASGHHLVITFFPQQTTNQALIEIYQYNNTTDITNQLNGATYCFTYLNA